MERGAHANGNSIVSAVNQEPVLSTVNQQPVVSAVNQEPEVLSVNEAVSVEIPPKSGFLQFITIPHRVKRSEIKRKRITNLNLTSERYIEYVTSRQKRKSFPIVNKVK